MPLLVIEALLLPSEPDESRYTALIADTTPPASRTQLRTLFGYAFGFVDESWELVVHRLKLRRPPTCGQCPLATSPPLRCSGSTSPRSILSLGGGAALVLYEMDLISTIESKALDAGANIVRKAEFRGDL
jgi:hypothetical protein